MAALIERGAAADYENAAGQTALTVASEKGVVHGIYALAMCGANVEHECRNGDTAVRSPAGPTPRVSSRLAYESCRYTRQYVYDVQMPSLIDYLRPYHPRLLLPSVR